MSIQSEEGIRPEDYQRETAEERAAQAEQRREANEKAEEEKKMDDLSQEIKDKLNMEGFDVKVSRTDDVGADAQVPPEESALQAN